MDSIAKCSCTACPVQASSACSERLNSKLMEALGDLKRGKMNMMTPNAQEVPRVYCSTGEATCVDRDLSKVCVCPSCLVWSQHRLAEGKPTWYFCRDGKSK